MSCVAIFVSLVCLVKTAAWFFAELVFCESAKMFSPEKGSGKRGFAS
jgi:hypothetical protein